jgi:hypothetical protein
MYKYGEKKAWKILGGGGALEKGLGEWGEMEEWRGT